jgi:hypothetical protein
MAVIPFNDTGKFNTQTSGIAVSTGAYDQVDLLRIPDVDPMFHMLNDGSALFYRMLSMLAKDEAATQPRFEFFEDDKYPVRTTVASVTSGGGPADTELEAVLTDGLATVNSVIYNKTNGEALLVTAVTGGTTITADRGHQGTTKGTVAADDELILIGAALPEGADANGGIAILPTKDYSFVSFFSQGCNATDVQEITDMLNQTGQLPREISKQTLFLMEQMDQHIRWSSRFSESHTDGQLYYTGGFNDRVTTNDITKADAMDWKWFNTTFNPVFEHTTSSPTKTLLCGQKLFSAITEISWDHFTLNGTPTFQTSLGATVQQIALDGGGIIDVVLDKYGFKSGTSETGQGFLIDMNSIALKPFKGFDLTWREVTQPQSHTKKLELFGSTGLKVWNEEVHAKLDYTHTYPA